jgi:hypothetical protein
MPFQSAALACVVLLGVIGYENVVTIPSLRTRTASARAPQILPTVSLVGMGARAEANPVDAPAAKDFVFELEIPGGPEFTGYTCEIRDSADALKFRLPVGTDQAKDVVRLEIPAAALPAGSYKLIVLGERSGSALQQLVQYPIQIH